MQCNRLRLISANLVRLSWLTHCKQRNQNIEFISPLNLLRESRRYAGHSKWANIKHIKGLKDAQKANEISRFIQRIQVSIREGGGPDPRTNTKLANIIEDAKASKIPLATITGALERAKSKPEGKSEQWVLRGPGRVLMLVDVLTDNRIQTRNELNTIVKKNGAIWLEESSLRQFQCEGKILCSKYNDIPISDECLDTALNDAIEAGAGDVIIEADEDHGKVLEFDVDPRELMKVKTKLRTLGYTVVFSDLIYTPVMLTKVSENDMKSLLLLREKLLANPYVMNVYDNMNEG